MLQGETTAAAAAEALDHHEGLLGREGRSKGDCWCGRAAVVGGGGGL